jgi:hypothetical protein
MSSHNWDVEKEGSKYTITRVFDKEMKSAYMMDESG